MKASQMREQTTEELQDRERELAEQLFALRLQKVTGQLEKPARVRQVRKDLARVLTLLRERELEPAGQGK
ncbi:MAG TPA: 50S ribosomal protein L29 [Thermoanaerobaculia bacterium]|jgi:large subunit ribosomal protein L29|nr:50S ribosomal protein L29 [Thermoanaerobaculia bacterium]